MAYRETSTGGEHADFMGRYAALVEAFDERRGLGEPLKLLRYAAVGLLTVDAPAKDVVARVYEHEAALKEALPWYRNLSVSGFVRLALSVALSKFGIEPAAFVRAHDDVREWAGGRHSRAMRGTYGMLATLILCIQNERRQPDQAQVERLLDIYGELRGHRWFLTGADDYPACAALTGCEGTAVEIGARAEGMSDHAVGIGGDRAAFVPSECPFWTMSWTHVRTACNTSHSPIDCASGPTLSLT